MLRALRSSVRALVLAAFAIAAACADYTQVSDRCPTFDSTGGDPTGDWMITRSCQVPYGRTTSEDWCSRLVYDEMGVEDGLVLGSEFIPVKSGQISYKANPTCGTPPCGDYEASLVFESPTDLPTTTHFPRACLSQHLAPADGNCIDLEGKIQALASKVLPTIQNLKCVDEPDLSGGCACSYIVSTSTIAADSGTWRVRDGLLVHYPLTYAQAGVTDIAIEGNRMQLHGHAGMPLLAHDPLRYLDLTRIVPP